MKNPLKFIQEVKQEAFKVSWPTSKETLQGALMVFAMAFAFVYFSSALLGDLEYKVSDVHSWFICLLGLEPCSTRTPIGSQLNPH